jgi:hypothetical protein
MSVLALFCVDSHSYVLPAYKIALQCVTAAYLCASSKLLCLFGACFYAYSGDLNELAPVQLLWCCIVPRMWCWADTLACTFMFLVTDNCMESKDAFLPIRQNKAHHELLG